MGEVSAEVTGPGLARRLLSCPEKFHGLNHRCAPAGPSELLLPPRGDPWLEARWLRLDGRADPETARCVPASAWRWGAWPLEGRVFSLPRAPSTPNQVTVGVSEWTQESFRAFLSLPSWGHTRTQ